MRVRFWIASLFCLLASPASWLPVVAGEVQATTYRLVEGSTITDDCPVCDRVPITHPLRGSFTMVSGGDNPLFTQFKLKDIHFAVGFGTNRAYAIEANGTYQIGGEVVLVQDMTLDGELNGKPVYFTNGTRTVSRQWPVLEIDLAQTNWTYTQALSLRLRAAPFQEIWFSTQGGLTPGTPLNPTNRVGSGDVISTAGRVIRSNADLIRALKLQSVPASLGLDAVDIGPGGEIMFALDQDAISENLGLLHHGDLLSERGRIVKRNQDLTASWGIMPPVPDLGLESAQIGETGRINYSIELPAFSERFGRMLTPGEIYSDDGQVVRTSGQLYARFSPKGDYGLKAFYIWSSGEVWFTPAKGFQDANLGAIQSGDLLSDQGYVVFHNRELVSAFQPLEDLANFGLNGLFIVTDVAPRAKSPSIHSFAYDAQTGNATLRWDGPGKTFQVERSDAAAGPYFPASPILPDLEYLDPAKLTPANAAYYRIRQW